MFTELALSEATRLYQAAVTVHASIEDEEERDAFYVNVLEAKGAMETAWLRSSMGVTTRRYVFELEPLLWEGDGA